MDLTPEELTFAEECLSRLAKDAQRRRGWRGRHLASFVGATVVVPLFAVAVCLFGAVGLFRRFWYGDGLWVGQGLSQESVHLNAKMQVLEMAYVLGLLAVAAVMVSCTCSAVKQIVQDRRSWPGDLLIARILREKLEADTAGGESARTQMT